MLDIIARLLISGSILIGTAHLPVPSAGQPQDALPVARA